jgi:hypothetical protein
MSKFQSPWPLIKVLLPGLQIRLRLIWCLRPNHEIQISEHAICQAFKFANVFFVKKNGEIWSKLKITLYHPETNIEAWISPSPPCRDFP